MPNQIKRSLQTFILLGSCLLLGLNLTSPAFALIHPIEYTDSGFNPQQFTILKNSSIQITNSSHLDLDLFSASFSKQKDSSTFNRGVITPGTIVTITLTELGEHIIQNRNNRSHNAYINIITKPFPISSETPFTTTNSAELLSGSNSKPSLAGQSEVSQTKNIKETYIETTPSILQEMNQDDDNTSSFVSTKLSNSWTIFIQAIILASLIFTSIILTIYIFTPNIIRIIHAIKDSKKTK